MEVANCFNNYSATVAKRTQQNNQSNIPPPTYYALDQQFNANGFCFKDVPRTDIEKAPLSLLKPHQEQKNQMNCTKNNYLVPLLIS